VFVPPGTPRMGHEATMEWTADSASRRGQQPRRCSAAACNLAASRASRQQQQATQPCRREQSAAARTALMRRRRWIARLLRSGRTDLDGPRGVQQFDAREGLAQHTAPRRCGVEQPLRVIQADMRLCPRQGQRHLLDGTRGASTRELLRHRTNSGRTLAAR
jgi:hypothetical protein